MGFSPRIAPSSEFLLFSLKKNCIIGPHFEAEIMVNSAKDIPKAIIKILNIIRQLKLRSWKNEEYSIHKKKCWSKIRKLTLPELLPLFGKSTVDSTELISHIVEKGHEK